MTVTADDNILPIIETTVDGDTLRIYAKQSYDTKLGINVKITLPALNGLSVSGSGDIHATGFRAGELDANIAGSGNIPWMAS